MFFAIEEGSMLSHGQIIYVQQEYALRFVPDQHSDYSILIIDVELGFCRSSDDIKQANQISGYCGAPTRWLQQQLSLPKFRPGRLLLYDETLEEGEVIRLKGSSTWNISYDPATSWMCFGEAKFHPGDVAIEFATGCGAIMQAQHLKALWVKPVFQ